jgi:hypothetical protein
MEMTMAKKSTVILINVTEAEREKVKALGRSRGYDITSDYLRSLIEADATAQGVDFKFDVNRGGYRERLDPSDG